MKAAILLIAIALPATFCYYYQPHYPARINTRNAPVYKSLGELFRRLHIAARCVNTYEEGCSNGAIDGAGADEDFLNNDTNPGKRCAVNTYDEGCSNGGLDGAGADEDWLNDGGANPGRR